ncbi:hypothetical protein E2C01_001517 [Portunus trituberculatus]|uniref:Uncharacterized protein n=1 Tax=Portunus trituberculatus TaxID=210409 RepID=A0A5B7CHU8_PORTR|nr:hypothetical protein [Portunus trituberculatus]
MLLKLSAGEAMAKREKGDADPSMRGTPHPPLVVHLTPHSPHTKVPSSPRRPPYSATSRRS